MRFSNEYCCCDAVLCEPLEDYLSTISDTEFCVQKLQFIKASPHVQEE